MSNVRQVSNPNYHTALCGPGARAPSLALDIPPMEHATDASSAQETEVPIRVVMGVGDRLKNRR